MPLLLLLFMLSLNSSCLEKNAKCAEEDQAALLEVYNLLYLENADAIAQNYSTSYQRTLFFFSEFVTAME
jgi:hypothetical protein